jgi:hypothetical protein
LEFGRFAHRHASKRGHKRPETIYFLGFTLYCTPNQKGNFRIGMQTEKSRLRRALMRLQDQMQRMRHLSIREQVNHLNQMFRGHYAYYGIAGNLGIAAGASGRGTLLAQNVEQSELARNGPMGVIPADQGTVSTASTKATSPVREICTLGSVEPEVGDCLRPPSGAQ